MPRRRVLKNKEKEIIIISNYLPGGLFGTTITWITEIIFLLKAHNLYPKFIIRSKNYGEAKDDFNIFPFIIDTKYKNYTSILPDIFKQFIVKKTEQEIFLSLEDIKKYNDKIQKENYLEDFKKVNQIFFEYFIINEHIYSRINNHFFNNKKVLGVQLRGTDKLTAVYDNPNNVSLEGIFKNIDIVLEKRKYQYIFLATDSIDFFREFKEKYKHLNIFYYDFVRYEKDESPYRSLDNKNIWEKRKFKDESYNILNAQNAFIDSLTLSKCDMVIFNSSALPSWSKVFNPELEIYKINFFPNKWFPCYFIPYFKEFINNYN